MLLISLVDVIYRQIGQHNIFSIRADLFAVQSYQFFLPCQNICIGENPYRPYHKNYGEHDNADVINSINKTRFNAVIRHSCRQGNR